MTTATRSPTGTRSVVGELAAQLRPPLLRLTRLVRNQRVDTAVTLTQLSVLATLGARGAMSAGDLAAYEKVQPPSMTKVLANLAELGYVRRDVHPTDRRQAIMSITVAGEELLESERRSRNVWLAMQLSKLSPDERALVRSVIPVLDKLASL